MPSIKLAKMRAKGPSFAAAKYAARKKAAPATGGGLLAPRNFARETNRKRGPA